MAGTCAALCVAAFAAAPALGQEVTDEDGLPVAVVPEEPAPPVVAAEPAPAPEPGAQAEAPDPGGEADPRPYLFVDGVAVLEVETGSPTPGLSRNWLPSPRAGAVGGALRAGPDGGPAVAAAAAPTVAPSVSIPVRFDTPGLYHVWVRAWAPDPAADSLHIGLDGEIQPLSTHLLTRTRGGWTWFRTRISYPTARLTVGTAGDHTVTLFMREDGIDVDRIVLSNRALGAPTGPGPAASPRGD